VTTTAVLDFARTHGLTITTWDLYQATWEELDGAVWQRVIIVDTPALTLATLILIDGQPSSSSFMRYPDEAALHAAHADEADAMIRAGYVLLPRPADTRAWAAHIQRLKADLVDRETAVAIGPDPRSHMRRFDTWLLQERAERARQRLDAAHTAARHLTAHLN
jgi:hypothetical protein